MAFASAKCNVEILHMLMWHYLNVFVKFVLSYIVHCSGIQYGPFINAIQGYVIWTLKTTTPYIMVHH